MNAMHIGLMKPPNISGVWLFLGLTTAAALSQVAKPATVSHDDETKILVGDICGNGTGVYREIGHCPSASSAETRRDTLTNNSLTCCLYEGKATRMCMKYGEAVWEYKKTFSILPQLVRKNQCAPSIRAVTFIVGGEKAGSDEYPHMALIGYGNDKRAPQWGCGGSLISERYVLTVAHCLQTIGRPARWVRLGELNLTNDHERNKHEDYEVESRIAHPDYKNSMYYHDVALLRLTNDVTFTASIRPACLYLITEVPEEELIASGWGYTDWEIPEISEHLMKVKLPVHKKEVCEDAFNNLAKLPNGFNDSTMMCAGSLQGGKDTCRGDSGGPLQLRHASPYCMYGIVGITSFGKKCGSRAPAVYTRVSHYVPWIESVVWADEKRI